MIFTTPNLLLQLPSFLVLQFLSYARMHNLAYAYCECGIVDSYDHNLVDIYHPLFEKYGVNLVLQGHAHTYERTYLLRFNSRDSEQPIVTGEDSNNNYRSQDGLVIATVGTGGAKPTSIYLPSELTAAQYGDLFGFLNVDVASDGTTLVGKFYDNADGEIKDTFTITKSSETAATSSAIDNSSSDGSDDESSLFDDSFDDSIFPDSDSSSDGDSESSDDDGSSKS